MSSPPAACSPLSFINLKKGHPNDRQLPNTALSQALFEVSQVLVSPPSQPPLIASSSDGESFLNYGDNAGNPNVLSALSTFVSSSASTHDEKSAADDGSPHPSRFFLTHGVSHALFLLSTSLLLLPSSASRRTVLVECPSYYLAGSVFSDSGLNVSPCPMDAVNGGVDVPLLRARLAAAGSDVLLVYVVPSNHNPTAATYGSERRRELAEACEEFAVHLVADEVYHMLTWEGEEAEGMDDGTPPLSTKAEKKRPSRMATLNKYEEESPSSFVISISSFTKVFCPGLRFGWIESHPSLISHLSQNGYINSQGGCCPLIGEVARRLILNGSIERNIQLLSLSYSSNVSAALDELSKCVPPSLLSVPFKPRGGYFLWVRVGEGVEDAEALIDTLLSDKNVAVLKGKLCDPIAGGNNIGIDLSRFFRICFAFLEGELVREGVRRIVEHANERSKAKL